MEHIGKGRSWKINPQRAGHTIHQGHSPSLGRSPQQRGVIGLQGATQFEPARKNVQHISTYGINIDKSECLGPKILNPTFWHGQKTWDMINLQEAHGRCSFFCFRRVSRYKPRQVYMNDGLGGALSYRGKVTDTLEPQEKPCSSGRSQGMKHDEYAYIDISI